MKENFELVKKLANFPIELKSDTIGVASGKCGFATLRNFFQISILENHSYDETRFY